MIATLAAAPTLHRRVVIVTDGVVTAGADTPALVAAIGALPIDRLDVVLAGGIRDERLAAALVRTALPYAGDVHDLDRDLDDAAAGLGEPVLVDVAVEVPGASWVYPSRIPAVRPGRSLMIYARMDAPADAIDVVIGGVRQRFDLARATPALVERALAGAEIEALEQQLAATVDAPTATVLRADIAARSVAARVLSSQTSMLVLETDADYARYQIERTALADVLVVGGAGIEQLHRTEIATIEPGSEPARQRQPRADQERFATREVADGAGPSDDADVQGGLLGTSSDEREGGFGLGRSGFGPGGGGSGWGTIGSGRYGTIGHGSATGSGYGVGAGRGGMRGRSADVPAARLGAPRVTGDLDRNIVRRYLRRNLPRLTYCYEKELLTRPTLAGEVTVQFTISGAARSREATASGVDADRCQLRRDGRPRDRALAAWRRPRPAPASRSRST